MSDVNDVPLFLLASGSGLSWKSFSEAKKYCNGYCIFICCFLSFDSPFLKSKICTKYLALTLTGLWSLSVSFTA